MNRRQFGLLAGALGVTATGVAHLGGVRSTMKSVVNGQQWKVRTSWDIPDLTGKTGKSMLQALVDIDNDGERELVANIGAQAHFVCYDQNQNLVWENIQDTNQHKGAYYPKVADGALFYGDRSSNTLYCVNLSDGSLRWSKSPGTGLEAIDICDYGVVFGGDTLTVFNYTDGSEIWSVSFNTYEQIVACGDLDGDGTDEVVAGNSNGTLTIRNSDGSEAFQITSDVAHYDLVSIGDIDPSHPGRELLAVVDDDASSTNSEGDELSTFDSEGQKLNSYTAGDGLNFAVGDFYPDSPGLEIAYGVESTTSVGLLNGTLTEQWTQTINSSTSNSGSQVGAADVDGDGAAELYVNTGEHPDAGFQLFNTDGTYLGEYIGHGWDIDPRPELSTGNASAKHYAYSPSGKQVLLKPSRLSASDTTGSEIIQLIERDSS